MSTHPTPDHILKVGLGFWASKTLLSAVELGVFTELAREPADLETLQQRLGLHERGSRDFLDALVALGFLERVDAQYRNSPNTDLFLDKAKPSYVGGILEMANLRLFRFWYHLTEGLRTGLPQNETKFGEASLFEELYGDEGRLSEFLAAMTGLSHAANLRIAESFPWEQYESFADIGAAQGDLAVQIARRHPHLRGVGFDLPEVEPVFADYVEKNGLSERLRFVPGNFFADDLPQADVLTMGHVLHDWSDGDKLVLIRKAYEALPKGGALIVYESMIDDDRSQNAFGLLMSLNMLIETPEGSDYTSADCQRWMEEANFSSTRAEHLLGPDSVVVGIK